MSYSYDYGLPPNQYYPETPNIRKRSSDYIVEEQSKRHANQYYEYGYHNNYQYPMSYQNNQTWNGHTYNNQITPDQSWYSAQGPSNYYPNDVSQRVTPPLHQGSHFATDNQIMQTPANYMNNSYSNTLFYTPESDTSSNNSQYFGAPMTAAQYHQHMHAQNFEHDQPTVAPFVQSHPDLNVLSTHDQQFLDQLSIEDIEQVVEARELDEELQKPQPYYHVPVANDDIVLDTVDGRLPIVLDSSRYDVKVEEMRRRLGSPEFINKSCLFSFFRISKQKNGGKEIQKLLDSCGLTVKPGQRHRADTKFTWLLEQEAIHLAENFDYMYKETCPVELLSWKVLEHYTSSGQTFASFKEKASNAFVIMQRILSLYKETQPKVTGVEEKYIRTKFDKHFASLSLLTHGFLHPHTISNFTKIFEILEKAGELADKVERGDIRKRVFTLLKEDEKPFESMSNKLFEYWKEQKDTDENSEEFQVDQITTELNELDAEISERILSGTPASEVNGESVKKRTHLDRTANEIIFDAYLNSVQNAVEDEHSNENAATKELEDDLGLLIDANTNTSSIIDSIQLEMDNENDVTSDDEDDYSDDEEEESSEENEDESFLELSNTELREKEVLSILEELVDTVVSQEYFNEETKTSISSVSSFEEIVDKLIADTWEAWTDIRSENASYTPNEELASYWIIPAFVPPTDVQLVEMTKEQLEALPVPEGEDPCYWSDKALFAMYEQS